MLVEKRIKIKQIKGLIGVRTSHKSCVKGLGLKRIGQVVELVDTPSIRGMVDKVSYLVKIVH